MPLTGDGEHSESVPKSDDAVLLLRHQPLVQPARTPSQANGLTALTWFWVILTIALAALLSFRHTWTTLFFIVLILLVGAILAYLVFKHLPDDTLTPSFLTMQLIMGSFPLTLLMALLQFLFIMFTGIALLSSGYSSWMHKVESLSGEDALHNNHTLSEDAALKNIEAILQMTRDHFPAWKLHLTFVLWSYLAYGVLVEASKWMLARRYRNLALDSVFRRRLGATSPIIGVRGILASSCMVAIGYATVLSVRFTNIPPFILSVDGFVTIWRTLLLFCIEVGSIFYIALADASRFVIKDRTSLTKSFLIAVAIHGTFAFLFWRDDYSHLLDKPPVWFGNVAPVVEIFLVAMLFYLCRSWYTKIRAKERGMMGSGML